MVISTTTSLVTLLGNGVTTVWNFSFVGVNANDLQVIYTDASGLETVLDPSQYTLFINPVAVGSLWGVGGTITYPTGTTPTPIQTGTFLTINRIVPYVQTVSIANQGAFYPQAVEQGLDLLELQIQQLETGLTYTLRTPLGDPEPPHVLPGFATRANGYLGFDNFGQPTIFTTAPAVSSLTAATPRVINTTGTSTKNILITDSFGGVSIYQSSNPVTTLQLPAGYGPYPVFDGSLNSSVYPIRVLPPAGLTIIGEPAFYLAQSGQSVVFYSDGFQILVG